MEDIGQLLGCAGNDSRIEAEEQAAQRSHGGSFYEVSVQPMSPVDGVVLRLFLHVEASINLPAPSTGCLKWPNLHVFALTTACPHPHIWRRFVRIVEEASYSSSARSALGRSSSRHSSKIR